MFYEHKKGYPGDGAKVSQAAQWLIGLNLPLEWTKPATEDADPFPYHCNKCGIDFGPEDDDDDCSQCKKCLSKDVVKQSERKKADG